jgi:hypothetical protein
MGCRADGTGRRTVEDLEQNVRLQPTKVMRQGCDRKKRETDCDGPIRDVTGASFVSILISSSCFLLLFN